MSEERLNDDFLAIETALASLVPVSSGVQRDRLMFLAGQASAKAAPLGRRRQATTWLWPCALSASILAALTFGLLWSSGGEQKVIERVVYVPAPSFSPALDFSPTVTTPSSPWENRRLCALVLEKGVDALPQFEAPAASTGPSAPRRDSYHELLDDLLKESHT